MSIKSIIGKFYRTYLGCGCMTLIITIIFAIVAFNATYDDIQKGDTLSPDDGANMAGFAAAFLVFAAGGMLCGSLFLYQCTSCTEITATGPE